MLLVKEYHTNGEIVRRFIFVGLIGEKKGVSSFLKRWRTSRVDTDSKGKPCQELMMTVLTEGVLGGSISSRIDWEHMNAEGDLVQSQDSILDLVGKVGGESWKEVARGAMQKCYQSSLES
jgi:hypothetical protein